MSPLQFLAVFAYLLLNLWAFIKGYYQVKNKNNPFGIARPFGVLGIFVWGDALVVAPFWIIVCLLTFVLGDWILFLLIISIFWSVRSAGEIIYWLNEQFAGKNRNPPHTLAFHSLFKNDSIWFIYQLYWQCILVFTILLTIFLSHLWLNQV